MSDEIRKVLAYWIVNEMLIPNAMPKKSNHLEKLTNKIDKNSKADKDSKPELEKFINCLPSKLDVSYSIKLPLNENNNKFVNCENEEKKIDEQKKKIYLYFGIDRNSEDEKKLHDLYTITDADYDICIGKVSQKKLYEFFYKTNKIDERIEKFYGDCCLFGLRINKEGAYVENSYNMSSFVWGIAKSCGKTGINWISENSEKYEEDRTTVESDLRDYEREHPNDAEGIINLAAEKTLKLIKNVNTDNIISAEEGLVFNSFYKDKKNFEKEKDNRLYNSEMNQSYFLKDMRMLQKQDLSNSKLKKYICYKSDSKSKKFDIKNDTKELSKNLHIKNYPLGKWPSKYNLSLMQQAAVNLSKSYLNTENPIFSVNGPPGTGKTTLLKEIIVDRIIERACIITEYKKANDAFTECSLSKEYDKFTKYYYKPNETLISYGILVASSNNAAVENITKELPLACDICSEKTLTELFDINKCKNTLPYKQYGKKDMVDKTDIYFTELANRLSKNSRQHDCNENSCWGLISVPLGKQSNIKKFYENVLKDFVYREKCDDEMFTNAKKDFKQQLEKVNKKRKTFIEENNYICNIKEISAEYDNNIIKIRNITDENNKLSQELQNLKKMIEKYKEKLKTTEKSIVVINNKIQEFESRFGGIMKFLLRLFKTQAYCDYEANQKILISLWCKKEDWECTVLKNEQECKQKELKQSELNETQQSLENRNKEIRELQTKVYKSDNKYYYKDNYGSKILDFENVDFSNDSAREDNSNIQKNNAWENKDYDEEREKLFYYALNLQKAFVLTSTHVLNNIRLISKMWGLQLSNDNTKIDFAAADKQNAMKHLFNTLFFITPVISSTFASIQSMLKDVTEENSLGLLIVDEAGQASPHMMLGAYYRAQTAIVVGDPKQIEPVVTTPDPIRNSFIEMKNYQSKTLSVQNFADNLNPFGINLKNSETGEEEWVGCPLTVHRRCIDPMFNISNKLSYGGIMVNSTEQINQQFCIKESKWLDVQGEEKKENKNHFVKEQAVAVFNMLVDYYKEKLDLPNAYIITPFTSVKNELCNFMSEQNNGKIDEKKLKDFLENSVGTVHTFQGKGTDEVFFVLGCDKNAKGAISWVNSNIVNVAVTRAKYRICIVGDKALWTEHSRILKNVNELGKFEQPVKDGQDNKS